MTLRVNPKWAALLVYLSFCGLPGRGHADSVTLTPRVVPVGKWATGLAFAGNAMWVSESGQRTIAQLDLDKGRVARRVTVGRLPTKMTLATDGAIYTLVETDKLVWQQFPNMAEGKAIGGLDGCPTGLTSGGGYLWVLSQCPGPEGSHVIRIDPRGGGRLSSKTIGQGGLDVITHQGKVWVAHFGSGLALTVVDEQTMAIRTSNIQAQFGALAASGGNVYAGATVNGNQELVMSINPATLQEVRRQSLDQRVAVMAADDRSVVAVGLGGKISVFSPDRLELQRVISLKTGAIEAQSVLIHGDDLYIANQQQQGENGAVLILSGWRPAAMPAPSPGGAPPGNTAECPYQVLNVSSGIWMYESANTKAPKVIAIPSNAKGLVADQCVKEWCHVTFLGATGWVEKRNIQANCN